jgi:LmbE family N-acetylglucosaminyl deacetylase
LHLFLSPHPDDAALSCGATIYQLAAEGERVVVLTLMAGDAPDPLPVSPLVEEIHARWGLGANPFIVRRAEDQRAVEYLGAEIAFGEWRDCIYRTDGTGIALYPNGDAIFGDIHPDDPLRLATLPLSKWAEKLTHLYVPLAAGNHVDHQLVRELALTWVAGQLAKVAVFFYGEYPYTSEAGEVLYSHTGQAERLAGVDALTSCPSHIVMAGSTRFAPHH